MLLRLWPPTGSPLLLGGVYERANCGSLLGHLHLLHVGGQEALRGLSLPPHSVRLLLLRLLLLRVWHGSQTHTCKAPHTRERGLVEAPLMGPGVRSPRPHVATGLWPAGRNEVLLRGAFAPAAAFVSTISAGSRRGPRRPWRRVLTQSNKTQRAQQPVPSVCASLESRNMWSRYG